MRQLKQLKQLHAAEDERATAAETANAEAIAAEVERATAAETANAEAIAAEVERATAAETANAEAIAAEVERATAAETANAEAIAAEVERATAAETANAEAIAAEVERATAAETANAEAIAAEVERATAAETANAEAIAAEVERATAAETANAEAIAAEVERATAAETANAEAIAAEVERATAAETANAEAFAAIISGTGLSNDGSYETNTNTNYINESISLVDATEDLDSTVADLLELVQNLTERVVNLELLTSGQGLTNTGTFGSDFTNTHDLVGYADFITQTFLSNKTGSLTEIKLYLRNDSDSIDDDPFFFMNELNLVLYTADGTMIQQTGYQSQDITGELGWVTYSFDNPPDVVAGTQYKFRVNGPMMCGAPGIVAGLNQSYADGYIEHDGDCSGGTIPDTYDLVFEVVVE